MNEKYLPIKIFEKRKDYDDRETEGGGNNKPKSWVLSGEKLIAHSKQLRDNIYAINDEFKKVKNGDKKLPLVISSAIIDKAIAKSYRNNIANLLESDNKDNVIGFSGDRQLLSIISSDKIITNITMAFENIDENAELISSINAIETFQPIVKRSSESENVYKIKLINYNNYDLNNLSKIIFRTRCQESNLKISSGTKFTNDLTIYRICLDNIEQLELLETFEGIYSIEPMESLEVSLDFFDDDTGIIVKKPNNDEDYPVVGVLDSGIALNRMLKNWVLDKKFISYPEEYQDNRHGTFVSGIIEYGDELNETNISVLDGVKVFNATVYPDIKKEKIYIDELVDNIRAAIEKNQNIKIWNLSLGTTLEAEIDRFSDFGIALDNIQDENNVLIIKSAGNCSNFLYNRPKSRISQSADSIRSIVVGSIAHSKAQYDYADELTPSPFTRIGPGPSNIIKPDLVYFGGNAGVYNGQIVKNGVASFSVDDKVVRDCGTSFSTPMVSRIAVELNHLISEEFDPLLIRALMLHSARYPENSKMVMHDKINQMGFGIPLNAAEILYNSPYEITLILRDTLEKGNFIEMFDFPFPKSLIDQNGYFRGQIVLTLVNKCLVDEKQDGEYCQSNIDVLFGTYESEIDRDITKPTIKNPRGVGAAKNILNSGLYGTRVMKEYSGTGFERECILTKYGKKFHPVKKYAVDLKDMTASNKEKYLSSERKWYLKIEGLYRDFVEKQASKNNDQLSQEYCMILTIKDPDHAVHVYDEVTQLLTYNNFIHNNIKINNNINISTTNN